MQKASRQNRKSHACRPWGREPKLCHLWEELVWFVSAGNERIEVPEPGQRFFFRIFGMAEMKELLAPIVDDRIVIDP